MRQAAQPGNGLPAAGTENNRFDAQSRCSFQSSVDRFIHAAAWLVSLGDGPVSGGM